MTFTLIAHRGYSDLAPENTLPAFDLALERGFPHMELDVQLTRDGVPVVIHDDDLDRTTDSRGPLRERTFEQLEAILAGSWFPSTNPEHTKAFSQARIPSLAQVLERYAGRAHLHVELKSEEQHLAATVAPLFARYGWDGREPDTVPGFTITSFHIEQLHRSRSLLPDVAHGWLLGAITEPDIDLACLLGLRAICPRAPTLSVESVHAATTRGLSVRAWGVRDEADLLLAYNSGAAGATVNWPERAQLALDAAGTPTIRSS